MPNRRRRPGASLAYRSRCVQATCILRTSLSPPIDPGRLKYALVQYAFRRSLSCQPSRSTAVFAHVYFVVTSCKLNSRPRNHGLRRHPTCLMKAIGDSQKVSITDAKVRLCLSWGMLSMETWLTLSAPLAPMLAGCQETQTYQSAQNNVSALETWPSTH